MPQWTTKLEALIRSAGEYADAQMKDLLNPEASAAGSTLRMLFRAAVSGNIVVKACREAGYEFQGPGFSDLQKLVDLAEQNGSDAADKIKKVLLAEKALKLEYRKDSAVTNSAAPYDVFRRIKIAKQGNIPY